MLRRLALLIGAAYPEGTPHFLPGVRLDMDNYVRFLQSPSGGAWQKEEIWWAPDPSKADLVHFAQQYQADYVLVVFSGHGSADPKTHRQILHLNPREAVWLNQVVPLAAKQLIILDACRVFQGDAGLSGFFGEERRYFPSQLPAANARQLFAQAVTACEPGRIVCYGCELGKTSQDSLTGGDFSNALLDTANQWVAQPSDRVYLPIHHAFAGAEHRLLAQPQVMQRPRIWSQQPARKHWFPFALRRPLQLL